MAAHDSRMDAYISRAAPFAQPILAYLRELVHEACPEVEESIKWGFPHFGYRGAMMCSMAAFKRHCAFGFWLHKEIVGEEPGEGMGGFGKITALADLPTRKKLAAYIRKAMALNEAGTRRKSVRPRPRPVAVLPEDVAALLAQAKHAAARRTWERFTNGMRRDYVDWIDEAKTDATRRKRVATALEWLAEGKQRNWKYMA